MIQGPVSYADGYGPPRVFLCCSSNRHQMASTATAFQERDSAPQSGRVSGTAGDAPLPCLSSNNSTEKLHVLGSQQRKTADLLRRSVDKMARVYGLERLGFFTLTFADHVTDPREAQRRYNSLNSHVLKKRYLDKVRVIERQKSGRLHYHLVVALGCDIRTGYVFDAAKRGDYRSANAALRAEWAYWRQTAPKYRFGRTELQPIESNSAAISKYVGKYISKHISQRLPEDKGVRLVEYSKGARDGTTRFAWVCASSWLWREKVRAWAASHGLENEDQVKAVFGKRWPWHCRKAILAFPLDEWPSMVHVMADATGPDPVGMYIPEDSGKITRFLEGHRQWQLESRCNSGWDAVGVFPHGEPGRTYKLNRDAVPPAIQQDRILQRFFGATPGQLDLPLDAKPRANAKFKRINPDGRAVFASL